MERIFVTKKVENRASYRKTSKEETHDHSCSAKYRLYAGMKESKTDEACCAHEEDEQTIKY
jgi:hypothetical protein